MCIFSVSDKTGTMMAQQEYFLDGSMHVNDEGSLEFSDGLVREGERLAVRFTDDSGIWLLNKGDAIELYPDKPVSIRS